jgi:GDP-4-dehydro-6-deoxy-D-mannose reductase
MIRERYLLTGSEGFLGRALRRQIATTNASLCCVDLAPSRRTDFVRLDLVDEPESLARVMADFRPQVVLHAAWSGGGVAALGRNLTATWNVLQGATGWGGDPLIATIGSAAEYGTQPYDSIPETAREVPVGTYGVFKLAQSRLVHVARAEGRRTTVFRLFNLIGPGLPASLAPAQFIEQLRQVGRKERSTVEFGGLSGVRDYLYVDDVARTILQLTGVDSLPDTVNICSGRETLMADMLKEIATQLGVSVVHGPERAPSQLQVARSIGSTERLRSLLGSVPSFDLRTAVRLSLSGS